MHNGYEDIRALTSAAPQWWDENGVPRYCEFHPKHIADIYADEAVLVTIACQSCHHKFPVAFSCSKTGRIMDAVRLDIQVTDSPTLRQMIENRSLHYGDPPNINCCSSGATMNCDDLFVVSYWHRGLEGANSWNWTRDPQFDQAPLGDSERV